MSHGLPSVSGGHGAVVASLFAQLIPNVRVPAEILTVAESENHLHSEEEFGERNEDWNVAQKLWMFRKRDPPLQPGKPSAHSGRFELPIPTPGLGVVVDVV